MFWVLAAEKGFRHSHFNTRCCSFPPPFFLSTVEVADALPYNHMADVYSYGIILWELNAAKKPFDGLNREMFYERVVHGGERPPLHKKKWPRELTSLMSECWDADMRNRPKFRDIVTRLDDMLNQEKGGTSAKKKNQFLPKISGMIDRHSTWF